jgi:hypothetical protein
LEDAKRALRTSIRQLTLGEFSYDTQIKDLPIFSHDKSTYQTSPSAKIFLHDSPLSDAPMYTPVILYRLLPAIAFNTAKILVGCPGVTSPVAPS